MYHWLLLPRFLDRQRRFRNLRMTSLNSQFSILANARVISHTTRYKPILQASSSGRRSTMPKLTIWNLKPPYSKTRSMSPSTLPKLGRFMTKFAWWRVSSVTLKNSMLNSSTRNLTITKARKIAQVEYFSNPSLINLISVPRLLSTTRTQRAAM